MHPRRVLGKVEEIRAIPNEFTGVPEGLRNFQRDYRTSHMYLPKSKDVLEWIAKKMELQKRS